MKLIKKTMARLGSNAGETLAETLVSVLVSSLAMVMLAGAIATAHRLVTASKHLDDTMLASETALATGVSTADGSAWDGKVQVKGGRSGASSSTDVDVSYVKETLPGNNICISYKAR